MVVTVSRDSVPVKIFDDADIESEDIETMVDSCFNEREKEFEGGRGASTSIEMAEELAEGKGGGGWNRSTSPTCPPPWSSSSV